MSFHKRAIHADSWTDIHLLTFVSTTSLMIFSKWSRIQFRFTVVHRVKVAVLSFFCVLCYRTIALSLSCYCIFVIAFLPSHYQASRLRSYTTGGDGQTMFHCNLYFVLISDVIVFFRVFTRNDKKVPSRTTINIYLNTF